MFIKLFLLFIVFFNIIPYASASRNCLVMKDDIIQDLDKLESDPIYHPDVLLEQKELDEKIREFEASLNQREKMIFEERLMSDDPLTLKELGEKLGLSPERIRVLESSLVLKLEKYTIYHLNRTSREQKTKAVIADFKKMGLNDLPYELIGNFSSDHRVLENYRRFITFLEDVRKELKKVTLNSNRKIKIGYEALEKITSINLKHFISQEYFNGACKSYSLYSKKTKSEIYKVVLVSVMEFLNLKRPSDLLWIEHGFVFRSASFNNEIELLKSTGILFEAGYKKWLNNLLNE